MKTIGKYLLHAAGRLVLGAVCALLAFASCDFLSIKEDRTPCPAWLTVESDGVFPPEVAGRGLHFGVWKTPSGVAHADTVEVRDESWERYAGGAVWFAVPRVTPLDVVAWTLVDGHSMEAREDSLLLVPVGAQCDSVYSLSLKTVIPADVEDVREAVPVNKDFSTVFLTVVNDGDIEYPYDYSVTAAYDGFSLVDMTPHKGPFDYSVPWEVKGHRASFRVPRQADDSMTLRIRRENGGAVVTTVPIGLTIRSLGFDWTERSLPDIYLVVDWAGNYVQVTVNGWTVRVILEYKM